MERTTPGRASAAGEAQGEGQDALGLRDRGQALIVYLDTSALVKLLIEERESERVASLVQKPARVFTSIATYVEARSGLARARREGRLPDAGHGSARSTLQRYWSNIAAIEFDWNLAVSAAELCERRGLRGYDAVHLASAISLETDETRFVCFDRELRHAAEAEGLAVPALGRG